MVQYLQVRSELKYEDRGWCNHAQYCEDGQIVQEREAHINFISRALYGISKYFGQQVPKEYDLIIDPDLFMKAFTYCNKEGRRVSADAWDLAPGYCRKPASSQTTATPSVSLPASSEPSQMHGPSTAQSLQTDDIEFISQDKVRKEARVRYHAYARHVSAHIPYEVVKSNGVAPLDPLELALGVERGGLGEGAYQVLIASSNDEDRVSETGASEDDDQPSEETADKRKKGGRPECRCSTFCTNK